MHISISLSNSSKSSIHIISTEKHFQFLHLDSSPGHALPVLTSPISLSWSPLASRLRLSLHFPRVPGSSWATITSHTFLSLFIHLPFVPQGCLSCSLNSAFVLPALTDLPHLPPSPPAAAQLYPCFLDNSPWQAQSLHFTPLLLSFLCLLPTHLKTSNVGGGGRGDKEEPSPSRIQ